MITSLLVVGCSLQNETGNTGGLPTPSSTPFKQVTPVPSPSPPIVYPKLRLNSRQKKYLNESFPSDIRKFFENADLLELLAEVEVDESSDGDPRSFNPNRIVVIGNSKQKQEILDAFYFDAGHEDSPAICFSPHHSLRATKDGKVLEVEICFECSRFEGAGSLQSVSGTIVRDGRRSEDLFNRIVNNQSSKYTP